MPRIHRSSRFWFWDDYERSQDIGELMILVMDPHPPPWCLGVWNGVYHAIALWLGWSIRMPSHGLLGSCMIGLTALKFDRIKVTIGGSWFGRFNVLFFEHIRFLRSHVWVSWVTIDPPYFIYFQSKMSMYGTEEFVAAKCKVKTIQSTRTPRRPTHDVKTW